jgi:hypothetical protein
MSTVFFLLRERRSVIKKLLKKSFYIIESISGPSNHFSKSVWEEVVDSIKKYAKKDEIQNKPHIKPSSSFFFFYHIKGFSP